METFGKPIPVIIQDDPQENPQMKLKRKHSNGMSTMACQPWLRGAGRAHGGAHSHVGLGQITFQGTAGAGAGVLEVNVGTCWNVDPTGMESVNDHSIFITNLI